MRAPLKKQSWTFAMRAESLLLHGHARTHQPSLRKRWGTAAVRMGTVEQITGRPCPRPSDSGTGNGAAKPPAAMCRRGAGGPGSKPRASKKEGVGIVRIALCASYRGLEREDPLSGARCKFYTLLVCRLALCWPTVSQVGAVAGSREKWAGRGKNSRNVRRRR